MSRSYRKHFIFATEGDKDFKKIYNRKVRRSSHMGNGSSYKKIGDSSRIKSYEFMYLNEDDYVVDGIKYGNGESEDYWRAQWRRHFRSK